MAYAPERGDVVWMDFDPQAGHEQGGRRPSLILSPSSYNSRIGLAILCPITSRIKGYSFEVLIPPGLAVTGVVLADQAKNMDWRARNAAFICKLPSTVIVEVRKKLSSLL
ncbi:MAG: endoribonuclease MazF [Blastocatellales bacterium]